MCLNREQDHTSNFVQLSNHPEQIQGHNQHNSGCTIMVTDGKKERDKERKRYRKKERKKERQPERKKKRKKERKIGVSRISCRV